MRIVIRMNKAMPVFACLVLSAVIPFPKGFDLMIYAAGSDRFEKARAFIQEKIKKEGLPSISIAVARDGKIIWEESWGLANIEKRIPATPRTMYSLASATKPITATAVMILAERGLVDLDAPASRYLGDGQLTGYQPLAATVRRLLQHTAGLPMHWNLIGGDEAFPRPAMDETIRRYGFLAAPPGEAFAYSNLGYGVLERIIERVSGRSYKDFVEREVFAPLGMDRSAVLPGPGREAGVALAYGARQEPFPPFDFDHRGASAAFCSAHDLARFAMFHLQNSLPGQKKILSAKAIRSMQSEKDPQVPASIYSLGWSSFVNSKIHFVSHSGGMLGVGARLTLLPEKDSACVVLANGAPTMEGTELWDVEWEILKAIVPGFPESPEIPPPPAAPAAFIPPDSLVGIWQGNVHANNADLPVQLTIENTGQVRLELDGQENVALAVPTPLGSLGFSDDILLAPFLAGLKTPDTARSPHILLLKLKLRGDKLDGVASAIAMNQRFCYPHWIELARQK